MEQLNPKEIREFFSKNHFDTFGIKRWVLDDEMEILIRLVKNFSVCYESGTANGFTSFFFSQAMNGLVHTFDIVDRPKIWDYLNLDSSRIKFYKNDFSIGVKDLIKKEEKKVFFIDGDHSKNGVKKDWNSISPFLNVNDLVIFHDVASPGPAKLLKSLSSDYIKTIHSNKKSRGIIAVQCLIT